MDVGIVSSLVDDPASVREAARSAGGSPIDRSLTAIDDVDPPVVPAVGDEAVRLAVEAGLTAPLLPIDASPGLGSVSASDLVSALEAVANGRAETVDHRALSVAIPNGDTGTAIREVALVTDEPATISEFEITSAGERIAEYRADGTVVATPAGSTGYARAAGGPILAPETDVLIAITVAPYRVDPDHWVVGPEDVRVTVTRDESTVIGLADGDVIGSVDTDEPVEITARRRFRTLRVPESPPRFPGSVT